MAGASIPLQHVTAAYRENGDSAFDRRLAKILACAAEVFCEKGYEGASVRDLSRASGMSLAGLYHYFDSKERLLYLLQKHTFTSIMERLSERLETTEDAEQRVRVFMQNHLEYFLAHQSAMKVLAHDAEVLRNGYGREISALKRDYYRRCLGVLESFKQARGLEFNSRTAVLSLFGMMNWIYTWYNPRFDGTAVELAAEMGDIFLSGLGGGRSRAVRRSRKKAPAD
jgi:AcrR family transcriptional regulator